MDKKDFHVITGGLNSEITADAAHFISAYVTDTRLMGVLAVYAHWSIDGGGDLHQFFHIDCEEAGLETCSIIRGRFGTKAVLTEQSLIGGLGADKIQLDEKSLRWLLQHWKKFNLKHFLPLPPNPSDYDFIFDETVVMLPEEQHRIMRDICGEISNDNQVVNYFLMRCFGQDYEGARYLAPPQSDGGVPLDGDFPLDLYDNYRKATFCRNVIDTDKRYADGSTSYLCESLIEMGGKYEMIISKVVVKDLKVIGFEHCGKSPVTATEAAMLLKKPEFTTVYEVLIDGNELEENIGEFIVSFNTVMTTHENGRMFMAFKPTNNHVAERIFMLSNDVKGVYFLTYHGQLIVMAHSDREIRALESRLDSSPLKPYLIPTAKYEFPDPVLFEFINSGFDDFEDFLRYITE